MLSRSALILVVLLAGCKGERARPGDAGAPARAAVGESSPARSDSPPRPAPLRWPCAEAPHVEQLAPGLTLETLRPAQAPAVAVEDPCLRVLRADPRRFEVVLGAAPEDPVGGPTWAERAGAVGVINASMYRPDGRSTGLLIDGEREHMGRVNPSFGAFFAARPVRDGLAPVRMWGEGCAGGSLDGLRRDYGIIAQNYRLLDCEGGAIAWKDEKVYSAAAVGVDARGNVLFVHSRAPYRMATFTQVLVDPGLGLELVAAMYVEGGPEATLAVRSGGREAVFLGSYETEFSEDDANVAPWELPNVLMLVARE